MLAAAAGSADVAALKREAHLLMRLRHPHVVLFMVRYYVII